MILNKIRWHLSVMLGVLAVFGLFATVTPVSAAQVDSKATTNATISFKRLNPVNPNLPADYVTSGVVASKTKTTPSNKVQTKPQASKTSVALPSKGTSSSKLPQTSSAEVPMILVVGGLLLSSAISMPIIGKRIRVH